MFVQYIVLILAFLQGATFAAAVGVVPAKEWRWRHSLDIDVRSKGAYVLRVNADAIHEALYQFEIQNTPFISFPIKKAPPNTLTAAITLLIQTSEGIKSYTTEIKPEGEDKPFLFCSSADTKFFDTTSRRSVIAEDIKELGWFNPSHFYPKKGELQPLLEAIGLTFRSDDNPAAHAYSDQNVNHTETKLLYYLLEQGGLEDQTNQALQTLQSTKATAKDIKGIILHIHTRYDPCTHCTDSLVGFKNHASRLLGIACPVMVTVSSRTAYDHARDMRGFDEHSHPPIPHGIVRSDGDGRGGATMTSAAAVAACRDDSGGGGAAAGSGSGAVDTMITLPYLNIHSIKPDVAQPYKFLHSMGDPH
jgi:hypothetical protein